MQDETYLGEFEELVLLAIMKLGSNAYGASVQETLEEAGRQVAIGALYTTFSRLEGKGYLNSRLGEPSKARGDRPKKIYRIEAKGEKALRNSENVRRRVSGDLVLGYESR